MARKVIDIGAVGNDGTCDSIRDSFRKVNDNFRELYSSLGLGERLTFIGLDDTPDAYAGYENAILAVNPTTDGLAFKQIVGGQGVSVDNRATEVRISSLFSQLVGDPSPALGGDLSAYSGGDYHKIINVQDPQLNARPDEVVNKKYVDTKLSRAGVDAVDPATGGPNIAFGRMTGPLILSRSPEPDDDAVYGGLIAATKAYVDGSAFGSGANLYVSTTGTDQRTGVSDQLQGRALAYAYRTIEAALKRAEELMLQSRNDIGPYKKLLTYNNRQGYCTLASIDTAPDSGNGFVGVVYMSVDTVTVNRVGSNYNVGDIITLATGTGTPARLEVLSTLTSPGGLVTFRVISQGLYTVLPTVGANGVTTTTNSNISHADPATNASFDITYKVNKITISNGGTGYGLVSVRIVGGGGTGAFGTADITNSVITSVTVTDPGSGFTSLPTVQVNLPRFYIYTAGYRTDYTGDVTTDTPTAFRGRDIREGLYIKGETSGALAQILSHDGSLDSLGNEIFDVDVQYGSFQIGEALSYGDVTKIDQITVFIESGIYEENYPLKVPQNVAVMGDEFRRTIVKPKPGTSASPWAFQKFRRDLTIGQYASGTTSDELIIADRLFGYHYLSDSSAPVYPRISNKGFYNSAAALVKLNKSFLQEEIIAWMNAQIENNIAPFTNSFRYNQIAFKRDIGLIIDSMIFDLKYGEYNRTISTGLKYYQTAEGQTAITTQLSQTLAAIERLNYLLQRIVLNQDVGTVYNEIFPQIIDQAFTSEVGSGTVVGLLITTLKDVIDGSGSVNYPKENDTLDVFLCNDATMVRRITCQGHGGFMMVLDPAGQILAKSPYCQESASFSKSTGVQTFAGGMFVDGFTGNLQFQVISKSSDIRLSIGGLDRRPNLPCSFIISDTVYRVNYVRDYTYSASGSTATLILDDTTPFTLPIFTYNQSICNRDVGLVVDGLGYDIVFGTNYNARKAALLYLEANASVVLSTQKQLTIAGFNTAHDLATAALTSNAVVTGYDYTAAKATVTASKSTFSAVIGGGAYYTPTLVLPNPSGLSTNLASAKTLLLANIDFIVDEVNAWVAAQVSGNISPFTSAFTYSSTDLKRKIRYSTEALAYDLVYGGNQMTRGIGLSYYDGVGDAITLQIPSGSETKYSAAVAYAKYLAKQVIQNLAPAATYSATPRVTGTAATATEAATIETLMSAVSATITGGVGSAPSLTLPSLTAYSYTTVLKGARTALQSAKSSIQTGVISYINTNANLYELLMPGNRSMLSNDFTQIADMGYGVIVTNGGLTEAVSMFTYYCHISYYSLNGGQIRSIAGSSAHGKYALVAQGSDPLEVPTPCTLWQDLSQRVDCYYPSPSYANTAGGLYVYVTNYNTPPLNNSELEVDHGNGLIYRYPVTSVTTTGYPTGVARLNLTSDTSGNFDGLYAVISDGIKMTLRSNSQVILTGGLADVATRPSTGLRLAESSDNVYRILQFEEYQDPNGPWEVSITTGTPGIFKILITVTTITSTSICTTSQNHQLKVGDKFIPTSTANGLTSGTTYYVVSVPNYNQFTLATSAGGTTITSLTNGTGLTIKGVKTHKLLAGYYFSFLTSGTYPSLINGSGLYYVTSANLTATEFSLSDTKLGDPLAIASAGTGTIRLVPEGLTKTTMRENYDYVNITLYQPGEYAKRTTTITNTSIATATMSTSSIAATTGILTVGTVSGTIYVGMLLSGGSIVANSTWITANISGSGAGSTWQTNTTIAQSSTTITGTASLVTLGSTTGLNLGMPIVFSNLTGGLASSGITAGTTYYIKVLDTAANRVALMATAGGNFVTLSTQTGTGTAVVGGSKAVTLVIGTGTVFTANAHGFTAGDVIRFETTGSLPTGLSISYHYFVIATNLTTNTFSVATTPSGIAVDTTGSQSGTHTVGRVSGRVSDSTFAVVALSPADTLRAQAGMKFVFKGEEYTISLYENESLTSQPYGRVTLDKPLVNAINYGVSSYTIGAAVPIRTSNAIGSLTIRISLTRVTGHDLLEIGTGSYADTNYPNEIYGPPVNPINQETETEERTVGRVFYVTTDQYGNFRVGPYFSVDQGTGQVTFSAAIALSNLDGIGFKRGVPISEFSTDSAFSDNATDTVPTENAARIYIERRLGITHGGAVVPDDQLLPPVIGGMMALSGVQAMKANMDMANHKILNVANPTVGTDAVNLQSLTFTNLQEFTTTNIRGGDLLVFTGVASNAINAQIGGDISLSMDSTANFLDAQINPGVIINADINATAAIDQSKLSMLAATTRANATGITQANRGLSSFDDSQFTVTGGWVTIKDNGVVLNKLEQITTKTVLGNAGLANANVSAVSFAIVVNDGGAVKKSQYQTTGFLRRTNASSNSIDTDYSVVEASSTYSGATDNSKIITRDSNGDFGAREGSLAKLLIDAQTSIDTSTTASGGYIRYYGYNTAGGILIQDGTVAVDKKTLYWNDTHQFKTQNGISDAPITCSAIQTLSLTTGGNTTNGTITGRWTLTGSSPNESRLQATYSADLAEYYEGDKEYEVGTVLVFGGDKEVTVTGKLADNRVAGVVSNTAAFVMYDACPGHKNLVALQGRVPCKVVGKIRKGDMLVTSKIFGVAVAAGEDVKVGTVVGKALVDYDSDHIGTIEIAVGRT